MTKRFSPQIESRLREAGWYPERQIAEEELQFMELLRPFFPAAQLAVREFSGLYFKKQGETVMRDGRLDSSNYRASFCIDPLALMEDDGMEIFDRYAQRLKRNVYPLGYRSLRYPSETGLTRVMGDDAMFIDEDGRVFLYRYSVIRVGRTIDEALINLLRLQGKKTGKGTAKSKAKAVAEGVGMQEWNIDSDEPDTFPPSRR